MQFLVSQEVCLDTWRNALTVAAAECKAHNGDYHHRTDPALIAKLEQFAEELPDGVRLFSPDQVRKAVSQHLASLKPFLTHTPACNLSPAKQKLWDEAEEALGRAPDAPDPTWDAAYDEIRTKRQKCDCGLEDLLA